MEPIVFWLALSSGLLQALGYVAYVRKSLHNEIRPNATTWLMFNYGTAMLVLLEWDRGADLPMLFLPIVCASMSMVVAYICVSKGNMHWPTAWKDRAAFLIDLSLTVGYAFAWLLAEHGNISEGTRENLVLVFLILSNASTFVSFAPLTLEAFRSPDHEHPLPWAIWSSAYTTLAAVTILESGFFTELLIYPVTNMFLHGMVAVLATRRYKKKSQKT